MKTMTPRRGRTLMDYAHYDFGGGINIEDSPQQLADNDLTQAVNVYLENDGDISLRRGMNAKGSLIPGSAGEGIFRFYQEIASGVPVSTAVTVMHVGDTLYNADTGVPISAIGGMGAGSQPMSCVRVFDPQRNGGTDILVMCTGVGGPYAYDGTTFYTFPAAPTSVVGARWCQLVSNVLWFGGMSSQPNLLAGSALGTPENTPGYATFSMSYPITGLGTLGVGLQTNLVVGMVQGITLITGVTPDTYVEQEIPNPDGVLAGRTMVTVDGVLYFLGNNAIYRYDGTQFTEISRKVRKWILNDPLYQDYAMNGNRASSWAMYWNRRLYFFYSSNNAGASNNVGLVYDLVRNGWTIYTGVILNGGAILNAPGDPNPAQCVVCDGTKGQQYAFDVFADSQFTASDNGTVISAKVQSKFFKIGDPGAIKHLLRVYLELFFLKAFSGTLNVATDYSVTPNMTSLSLSNSGQPQWDVAQWDQAQWAATALLYTNTRTDMQLSGEAFSFGLQTPDPGGSQSAYQTWRLMGFTGRISQWPKA